MTEKEVKQEISKIKKRLEKIENVLFSENLQVGRKTIKQKKYSGLAGGIQLLLDNNFLDVPKDVPTIVSELKREAFHYPTESVRAALSRDFTKKKRILTRVQENNKYKYVKRKWW